MLVKNIKADHVFIACGYTDMRKSINGLSALVQQNMHLDPYASSLFLFCGRKPDRIKEVYFYSFINGEAVQCYTFAEQYELDENELAEVFSEIVEIIKDSKLYIPDKYNVRTISIDKSGIKLDMGYYDVDASEYRIQKEWKKDKIDSL